MIPIIRKPLQDELLYSWIYRLADMNGIDIGIFLESYCGKKRASYGALKPDARSEFLTLYNHIYNAAYPLELYFMLSTFKFEAMVMTKGQQMRYINNVFRPSGKLNMPVNTLFNDIKICPECVKEDKIPYIHRSHQLSGVYTCYMHKCKLHIFTGKKGHEMEFSLNEYHEIESDVHTQTLNAYTAYVQSLFQADIGTDAKILKKVLFSKMKELGYTAIGNYQTFLEKVKTWKYKELFVDNIADFLKIKMIAAEYIKIQEVVPFFMFLYPNVDELIQVLASGESIAQTYYCLECGNEYVATPDSQRNGWGCPYCAQKVAENDYFNKLIEIIGKKKYVLKTDFNTLDKQVVMHHTECGRDFTIKPRGFLFEGIRCKCENLITEYDARKVIEKKNEFKLIEFNGGNNPVTILHNKCGKIFTCNYRKFVQFPGCRICKPKYMTDELYAERVRALVGNEYEIVKGFIDQKTNVVIRHCICGREQSYKPSSFIDGQRCKNCYQQVTHRKLEQMLQEYSEDRYRISKYGKNLCTIIDDNTGKEINISPANVLQEILRPTVSEVLPVEQKKEVSEPLSQWEVGFKYLTEYKNEFGHTNVPKRESYKGYALGIWCQSQRGKYQSGALRENRKEKLENIEFDFDPLETEWNRRYEQYKRYIKEMGTSKITRRAGYEGEHLGAWVETQRKRYADNKMSQTRVDKLLKLDSNFF